MKSMILRLMCEYGNTTGNYRCLGARGYKPYPLVFVLVIGHYKAPVKLCGTKPARSVVRPGI